MTLPILRALDVGSDIQHSITNIGRLVVGCNQYTTQTDQFNDLLQVDLIKEMFMFSNFHEWMY